MCSFVLPIKTKKLKMKRKTTSTSSKKVDKRNIEIANRLRQIRKDNVLTQVEFAEIVGLSSPAIGAMENGLYLPNIEVLSVIKSRFGLDYNYVLDGERSSESEDTKKLHEEIERLKKTIDKLLK